MKVLAWYLDLNAIENKNTVKFLYPTGTQKCDILVIDTQTVSNQKEDDTSPTQVLTSNSKTIPRLKVVAVRTISD
jgi:hypothetical protein